MSALRKLGVAAKPSPADGRSADQMQTEATFGFKWAKRDTYESPAFQKATRDWLFERYCGDDLLALDRWLGGGGKVILDAGCGSGNAAMLFFGQHLRTNSYLGVDISSAVDVAAQRFKAAELPGDFLRADLMDTGIPQGSVDLIFSEGVLHHTDNTARAFAELAKLLKPGGRFLFYVYAKKAVIREFTDDHIRAALSSMSDSEAWEALRPLTRLGEQLGKLKATIEVTDDIPYLGIRKGKFDLQRFFYWNVCKLHFRPDFSEEEMNHINFDWFRPLNCHRHTPNEVSGWCKSAGLEIERMDVQESGITVVARAP